jgi:transposase
MRRFDLSEGQWDLISDLFPGPAESGRPPSDPRVMLNGCFWILNTGASWRDLPERYGPWQTVYDHFNRWAKDGTFERILERLQMELNIDGAIDWDLWCVDGTNVRAHVSAAGAGKKGGLTSQPIMLSDARAEVLAAKSILFPTREARRSRPKLPLAKRTSRRSSKP